MASQSLTALHSVTFRHEGAPEPLFSNLSVHFPPGFTGIVGANGVGKTSLLRLVCGELQSESGDVQRLTPACYCAQRTDHPPADLWQLLEDSSADTYAMRGRLGIEDDVVSSWHTLSDGERKRVQIAHALWCRPRLLAIDEPTNHIDQSARTLLMDALARFRGVGLVVSHDRDLLDTLCDQCLWLETTGATVYPGGYSQAEAQRSQEQETAAQQRHKLVRERDRLQHELVARREAAAHSDRKRSKRGLSAKDHDARERIDRGRLTGKDGQAGRLLRQLDSRAARSAQQAQSASVTRVHELGIWLPGSRSPRSRVLFCDAQTIVLNENRRLHLPLLSIGSDERVVITGDNGSGKTTLLRHLLGQINVPMEQLVYLPQELTADAGAEVLKRVRELPNEQLGHVMNVVRRLGSDPRRLLDSQQPSPGELRKLLLALGTTSEPHLLILDEPTNHLDLPSLNALESALADCPCALIVVSHDQRFLDQLGGTTWHVDSDSAGNSTLLPG